jgi:Subtilase family/FG-GAP-like repeat
MFRRFYFAFIFLLLAILLSLRADAAWPPPSDDTGFDYSDPVNWPNDPGYAGQWGLWSFVPPKLVNQVDDVSKRLGTGMHVDRAFAKTTGDPRVIVAVTDSGIEWTQAELINRIFLNAGELPPPACNGNTTKYDLNGDGRFNVQDYTTVTGHALPAFASVCDARIKDINANGVLDPQDLIAAFSDGKDDDGNGYIDDISGWDFFTNDNDPQDDTQFGHGTGSSKDGMSEGNNMMDGIGSCPDCTLMMLRVGDAFVPEVNHWSVAVAYAVDIGASVVNISGGGGLSNPQLSIDAIEYAWNNDVTIVASNSDLDSFHHNYPNTHDHVISVHAISYDSQQLNSAKTFFNFEICTNYGAQLMFSIPTTSCSSGAAGLSGGVAGMLYSAALAGDVPAPRTTAGDPMGNRRLTAEEVRQLLIGTVDNFYDPADATDPTKYPTTMGFARRFGYGRPNVRNAVDAILAGKLPPEATIGKPDWFEVLDPKKTPQVSIEGRVGVRGADMNPSGTTFDYVVEWAPGVDPDDSAFQMIGQAEMQSSAVDGPLGSWDISSLTVNNPVGKPGSPGWQPDDASNVHLVTLRVRATLHSSNPALDGLKGENRKAVHIYTDPDLLPGFPVFVGASGEGSPHVVDLLGNGKREIVYADTNGNVHAISADGTELPGWPVQTGLLPLLDPASHQGAGHAAAPAFSGATPAISPLRHTPVGSAPGIGDIDGDGKPEVVVSDWHGYVHAFHDDGSAVSGFPVEMVRDSAQLARDGGGGNDGAGVELEDGFFASPVLVDLDGDGKLDIVAAGMDARVYAWKGDGSLVSGFPVIVQDDTQPRPARERMVDTPAVGDLDGDGVPDIVVGTNENYNSQGRLYAISGKGTNGNGGAFLPGWPISIVTTRFLPVVAQGLPVSPALVDIDGDKVPEVVMSGIAATLKVYDKSGKPVRTFPNNKDKYGSKSPATNATEATFAAPPAVGDLDNDGTPDVVQGALGSDALLAFASGATRHDFEHHIAAWDMKSGNFKKGWPQIVEDWQLFSTPTIADVDGDGKVDVLVGSGGYFVHAWNVDGVEAKGFPKFTGGWALTSPAVGDLDGDGKLEVVATTRNGYVYAWKTAASAKGRIDWDSFHHDARNTGNFATALDQGKPASPSGCSLGGRADGGGPFVILVLAALGRIAYARRRWRTR